MYNLYRRSWLSSFLWFFMLLKGYRDLLFFEFTDNLLH